MTKKDWSYCWLLMFVGASGLDMTLRSLGLNLLATAIGILIWAGILRVWKGRIFLESDYNRGVMNAADLLRSTAINWKTGNEGYSPEAQAKFLEKSKTLNDMADSVERIRT